MSIKQGQRVRLENTRHSVLSRCCDNSAVQALGRFAETSSSVIKGFTIRSLPCSNEGWTHHPYLPFGSPSRDQELWPVLACLLIRDLIRNGDCHSQDGFEVGSSRPATVPAGIPVELPLITFTASPVLIESVND